MSTPFGRYLLESRIAAGGMGEVYLARMAGAGGFEKRVVIKRVLPHLSESKEFVDRFLDEGRLVVQLNHSNIAQILDMGEVDGQYFMAIEYVDGLDLRSMIRQLRERKTPCPIEVALHVIGEVAKGLHYAHTRTSESGKSLGIIHRDVSPSNVVISRSGEVKLLDFGIAMAHERRVESVSGALHGKFVYMSPEQAAGRPLDPRSDLFSLGVVLYELLAGIRPFEGESDLRTLELIREAKHKPITVYRSDLPRAVVDIVERLLDPVPDRRFRSGDELHRAILGYFLEARVVVSHGDLTALTRPLLASKAPVPLTLDDALNHQFDALLGGGSPGRAGSSPATRVGAVPETVDIVRPTTATTGRTLEADAPVPRSSRNRILIASVVLLVTVLVAMNLTMLSKLDERDRESYVAPAILPLPASPVPGPALAPMPTDAVAQPPVVAPDTTPVRPETALSARPFESTEDPRGQVRGEIEVASAPPPEPEHRTVTVDVEPKEATLTARGKSEKESMRLKLKPGEAVEVSASLDGYASASTKVTFSGKSSVTLRLKQLGTLQVRIFPASASIKVDGRPRKVGQGNVLSTPLEPGQHDLVVQCDDCIPPRFETTFTIDAGKETKLSQIRLEKASPPP
jgi:serine/threonine protein kinase